MLEIEYSAVANSDLEQIMMNITEFAGLQSAVNILGDIQKSVALLPTMPEMGVGDVIDTREIYSRGYRIVYRITENNILIITIVHCRQLYPPLA
ncbi:type II toxin-antitoxin system RelE/ParE family toxin [Testudinibacter sp. TR-2022]|uniref:type II toxin-antitoxin system RelE/ParE family toxin n=1 Tax=Testudinibacter sp. TR-2022 TaxID=2585029 RepID=UPI0011197B98|nr:type II toxin-antitoxin system RelE/ParE family toxin [Testudinibacter sp. TR-2022]TNH07288.1 type II toxin-antitoxin system RelE/ParE family toxin [Pasteurellaceae bacterium Phil11]TNH23760.1 type II toxin-antitoxin system RelE/ParE family toxin [Testudinibacter sp. TR-2022]TNH25169.1 type II toxin-antitoxin system RelE/ParE family toxin [Testudinibacter sp. TR-2022]